MTFLGLSGMLCVFTETSPPWLMGTQVIPGSMTILGIIWLTALWQLFFPGSCFFFFFFSPLVSPYTCTDCYSAKYSGEPLHRFLELFLLVVPSAPVCYPANLPFFEAASSSLNSNLCFLNCLRLLGSGSIFWSVKLKFCERTISHPIQFRGNQEIKSTYEK